MRNINIFFRFIFIMTFGVLVITGCASFGFNSDILTIRTEGNLSTVRPGGTLRLSTTGQGITWTVSSTRDGTGPVAPGTSISPNGVLTVSIDETSDSLFVFARSAREQSGFRQIRVTIVTDVFVNPAGQSVFRGRTQQFNTSVRGSNNPDNSVTWRVSSNAAGTGAVTQGTVINRNGLLTISARETLTALYVIANSVVDPRISGYARITVIIPVVTSVAVSSVNHSVASGSTLQFNALVMGTNIPDNSVTWRVSSNAAGTGAVTRGTSINARGLLTVAVNETMTTLFVFATSTEDPTRTGSAAVTVIIPTVTNVAVHPTGQTIQRGGTLQFNALVSGSNNPSSAVTWRVSTNAAGTGPVTHGTSINANGLLRVGANETAATLYIIATSVVDTRMSGSTAVLVTAPPVVTPPVVTPPVVTPPVVTPPVVTPPVTPPPPPPPPTAPTVTSVTVTPTGQTIQVGSPVQFSATVTGTNNPGTAVTWRVSSTADGTGAVANGTTINPNGRLTISANETAPVLWVIATSRVTPSVSGSTAVTVIRRH